MTASAAATKFIDAIESNMYPPLTHPQTANGFLKTYIAGDITSREAEHAMEITKTNNTLYELNEIMHGPRLPIDEFRSYLANALRRQIAPEFIRKHPAYVAFRTDPARQQRFTILDDLVENLV